MDKNTNHSQICSSIKIIKLQSNKPLFSHEIVLFLPASLYFVRRTLQRSLSDPGRVIQTFGEICLLFVVFLGIPLKGFVYLLEI
jgi:hypothetical protein